MRSLAVLLLSTAACAQTAFPGTALGAFSLHFDPRDGGNACDMADGAFIAGGGGIADTTATLSLDNKQNVFFTLQGQKPRAATLTSDHLEVTSAVPKFPGVPGCTCLVDISERLSADLERARDRDGGIPDAPFVALSGILADGFDASFNNSDGGCGCQMPCSISYTVTGRPL